MSTWKLNTRELAEVYREAFNALPECYQADDCLVFWEEQTWERGDFLYCRPSVGQEQALGNWVLEYDFETRDWVTPIRSQDQKKRP